MEWNMPDGTVFSVRSSDTEPDCTSVTAIIGGQPYAARVELRPEDVDISDLATIDLVRIPDENVYPVCPDGVSRIDTVLPSLHFLKSPTFSFEDAVTGHTFVAERLLAEVDIYEQLARNPHPNIAHYFGVVVENSRIKQICLKRYVRNLADLDEKQAADWWNAKVNQVVSAVRHLHKLGYAHNDLDMNNICLDENDDAILIDMDACLPFGAPIQKGKSYDGFEVRSSDRTNDWLGIAELDGVFLRPAADLE